LVLATASNWFAACGLELGRLIAQVLRVVETRAQPKIVPSLCKNFVSKILHHFSAPFQSGSFDTNIS
jgi:hypothetical protein